MNTTDILGVKPLSEAVNKTVDKTIEGTEGFLKLVCVPALEEFGLLLKDKVRVWRLNNVRKMLEKAQDKFEFIEDKLQIKANPRIALSIIENCSLNENEEIQELWAGLFVSSMSKEYQDDENLIFVDLLKQLTIPEAKIIKFCCENARKIIFKNGLIFGEEITLKYEDLKVITKIENLHRLDRELDHLRSLELIDGGFDAYDEKLVAKIRATPILLNLYIKSQGSQLSPEIYWSKDLVEHEEVEII